MYVADATSDPVEIGILRSTAVFLREPKFCRRVRRRTSPPPLGAGTVALIGPSADTLCDSVLVFWSAPRRSAEVEPRHLKVARWPR
jgi:hypothetical protein